jgi:hypothetical protein
VAGGEARRRRRGRGEPDGPRGKRPPGGEGAHLREAASGHCRAPRPPPGPPPPPPPPLEPYLISRHPSPTPLWLTPSQGLIHKDAVWACIPTPNRLRNMNVLLLGKKQEK